MVSCRSHRVSVAVLLGVVVIGCSDPDVTAPEAALPASPPAISLAVSVGGDSYSNTLVATRSLDSISVQLEDRPYITLLHFTISGSVTERWTSTSQPYNPSLWGQAAGPPLGRKGVGCSERVSPQLVFPTVQPTSWPRRIVLEQATHSPWMNGGEFRARAV